MARLLAVTNLGLVLKNDDLFTASLLDHTSDDLCAVNQRPALSKTTVIRHEQYVSQLDGLTFLIRKLLDLDDLTRLDAVLLAASLYDCERHPTFLRLWCKNAHQKLTAPI